MSNYHLRDKDLTNKAKGLLSVMLSLPDDWDFTIEGLSLMSKDGIDGVRVQLKELEKSGYLKRQRVRDEKGRLLNSEYDVYEEPIWENPILEKPILEKPIQENPMQLNTNILNTNITKEKENIKRKSFTPPSLEEVLEYIREKQLNVDGNMFYHYFSEGDWVDSRGNKVKNWKQKLLTWDSHHQSQKKTYTLDEMNVGEADIDKIRSQMFGGKK